MVTRPRTVYSVLDLRIVQPECRKTAYVRSFREERKFPLISHFNSNELDVVYVPLLAVLL